MEDSCEQQQAAVRLDWGQAGAAAISVGADYAVVVDILSFSTTVSVALDDGAEVFPYRWRDASAAAFARAHDATLAVGRSETGQTDAGQPETGRGDKAKGDRNHREDPRRRDRSARRGRDRQASPMVSLSPASIRAATGLRRIVLPSPNGSALSAGLAASEATVLTASFRNRTAIAHWLAADAARRGDGTDKAPRPPIIAVVAAGERWPDGSLRPAVEDLWGAGALIAALAARGLTDLSPEAATAAAAFAAIESRLPAQLAATASGRELASLGFAADVTIAAELDVSATVPRLADGRYTDAARITGERAGRPENRA